MPKFDINEKSTWDRIAGIGQSKIAKASIVAPLLSYAIIYSDFFNSIFNNNFSDENIYLNFLNLELSGSCVENCTYGFLSPRYRLKFTYFGLNIFSIASILFLYAPEIFRFYRSDAAYFLERSPLFGEDRIDNYVSELKGLLSREDEIKYFTPEMEIYYLKNLIGKYNKITDEKEKVSMFPELMASKFAISKYENPRLRKLIFSLYAVGILLLSMTFFDSTMRVISTFWH